MSKSKDHYFLYSDEFLDNEEAEYRIEDWLPKDGVSVLYAPKDHFKSFLAIDWALCIATGIPWKGFEVEQGAVLYIAGEGNYGLRKRVRAWALYNKQELDKIPIAISKNAISILKESVVEEWLEHVDFAVERFKQPLGLIVIDTLASSMGAGDENSPTDMAEFLNVLKTKFKARYDCTVLVVHHTGKDRTKGARGGSSIEGNAECVYEISRVKHTKDELEENDEEPSKKTIRLSCKHIKDAEPPKPIELKSVVQELGYTNKYGKQVTSLVLELTFSIIELKVLELTRANMSQRDIAKHISNDTKTYTQTQIKRIQDKFREKGLLEPDKPGRKKKNEENQEEPIVL
ncbi:AAA family ATPase [Magnetovirga frankeli]|uniref:AAA family ATPase n=1 Tax=Magnetovirga frankeli TaxID=947516 RepID=UPI001AF25446|nr:AAA family ATPase [gamma proteobacterium SS-5]